MGRWKLIPYIKSFIFQFCIFELMLRIIEIAKPLLKVIIWQQNVQEHTVLTRLDLMHIAKLAHKFHHLPFLDKNKENFKGFTVFLQFCQKSTFLVVFLQTRIQINIFRDFLLGFFVQEIQTRHLQLPLKNFRNHKHLGVVVKRQDLFFRQDKSANRKFTLLFENVPVSQTVDFE